LQATILSPSEARNVATGNTIILYLKVLKVCHQSSFVQAFLITDYHKKYLISHQWSNANPAFLLPEVCYSSSEIGAIKCDAFFLQLAFANRSIGNEAKPHGLLPIVS